MTTQLTHAAAPVKTSGRGSGRARGGQAADVGRPGFAWAVPATIFFVLFAILPLLAVAVLSFMSWGGIGDPEWVGLDNWSRVFDDPVMIKSIW
jgi:xylobiose transport system permease protein